MKKSRFPDSLVLIFAMILVAQAATYLLPAGVYDMEENAQGSMQVVAGSFHEVETEPLGPLHFLTAIPRTMAEHDAASIIFLVFIVGGAIGVIRASGAFDAMIGMAIRHVGHRPGILIGVMLTLFAVGSSTIGMAEEYMPFIPILVTMCIALRMDAMVAMGIVYIGAGVGYGCAALNPFTVVIAQRIADVQILSGQAVRWGLLPVFLALGMIHLMRYVRRIQRDPSKSLVGDVDYSSGFEMPEDVHLSWQRVTILVAFAAGIGVFVAGVKMWDWYLNELSGLFIALALLAGFLTRLGPSRMAREFCKGAAEMTTTALLIGFARTIETVLTDGQVIHTVVHAVAIPLKQLPSELSAIGMFGVQSVCNFFVPSGSGQAYVTMPIMTPLADLTGVPRQTAVLAYQFGDGFTNMVVPTNALLMGMLALGRIPFQRWLRFIGPLMVQMFLLGALILVLAVRLGYA